MLLVVKHLFHNLLSQDKMVGTLKLASSFFEGSNDVAESLLWLTDYNLLPVPEKLQNFAYEIVCARAKCFREFFLAPYTWVLSHLFGFVLSFVKAMKSRQSDYPCLTKEERMFVEVCLIEFRTYNG